MKRTFLLKGLCCANCAAKMERLVSKIDGISEASISFMTQKLIIECEEGTDVQEKIVAAVKKIDPQVEVCEKK